METVGAFLGEEWESLSKMFSGGDNLDFLLHCDGGSLFSTDGEIPSTAFLAASENSYLPSHAHNFDTNFCCISQESSNTSEIEGALFPNNQGDEDNHQPLFLHGDVTCNKFDQSMNFYSMDCDNDSLMMMMMMMPVFPDDVMEEIPHLKGENRPSEMGDSCKEMQMKRKYEPPESPKKIPRVSRNKNQRAAQSKKNKKSIQDKNNEGQSNAGGNRQSSSSCSSEDDSNASQELNGGSTSESKGSARLNSNGKTKASRGSATDPQSLYARRRRERINERLRILQNLVPNGTKVDISTMLEEAVHYVKFLQLQIKLLSSDDLWMYAPIAYNGMDIGMYQKMSPNLRPQN